jgi:hypothetical protein
LTPLSCGVASPADRELGFPRQQSQSGSLPSVPVEVGRFHARCIRTALVTAPFSVWHWSACLWPRRCGRYFVRPPNLAASRYFDSARLSWAWIHSPRPTEITFAEMRDTGVRGILVRRGTEFPGIPRGSPVKPRGSATSKARRLRAVGEARRVRLRRNISGCGVGMKPVAMMGLSLVSFTEVRAP